MLDEVDLLTGVSGGSSPRWPTVSAATSSSTSSRMAPLNATLWAN